MSVAAAEQVVISGGTNVGVASGGRVVINNWRKASLPQQSSQAYERAKHSLEQHVVPDAFYDSEANISAGSCHPGTRISVLATLKQRLTSDDPDVKGICWLFGPAGAGKSAIVRSLGEQLDDEDLLGGSFFFFRTDARRNVPHEFMATLTYQICVALPKLRAYVEQAIEKEQLIFDRSPKKQLKTLLLQPALKAMAHGVLDADDRKILLVDGLDECGEKEQQRELVLALHELAQKFPTKLSILIASRPERHLRDVFEEEPLQSACSTVALDETFEPDVDIRKYLVDKFNEILRRHPLRAQLLKLIVKWPTPEAVDQLISRASGQFIYATTVIKFVSSTRANPVERLEIVLGTRDPGNLEPFEQLDALYATILRSAPPEDISEIVDILVILSAMLGTWSSSVGFPLQPESVETLLSMQPGSIKLLLVDLESVVDISDEPDRGIQFYHKSFSEYLFDSRRSLSFSRSSKKTHSRLLAACLDYLNKHWSDIPKSVLSLDGSIAWQLSSFTSRAIQAHAHTSELSEELVESVRKIFARHLADAESGWDGRTPAQSLSFMISACSSTALWLRSETPIPPYASALWDYFKACSRTLFELAVAPSNPKAIAAMWCGCVWADNDFPSSESCDDEVGWMVLSAPHSSPWQNKQPGDPTSCLYTLLKTIKISSVIEYCCLPRMVVSLVYRPIWKECVLALCLALLMAPSTVERSILEAMSDLPGNQTISLIAQRALITLLKMAPVDNEELNALKAAGNPFPRDLGYEHGFDEVLRGEEIPPLPDQPDGEEVKELGDEDTGMGLGSKEGGGCSDATNAVVSDGDFVEEPVAQG